MKGLGKKIALYALLLLALLWTVVPLGWMVLSSFKRPDDLVSQTPTLFFAPTFQNYVGLFTGGNALGGYITNSILAAGISTLIAVTLGCLAGYGLARSHFRGKDHVSFWIISTRMAPIAAVILPLYAVFRTLDLLNTTTGLIVAYLTFNLPFAIWIMNAFFADLPPALEEAAMVDGATKFGAFWRIALPLTAPGIVTTAILCLVFSWNDYAFAQSFSGPGSQTLPIAASQLITQTGINWGQLMAIGTIVVLPMVVVGLAVRRYLVKGLTLGAVTGE
ncbi:Various polyols ABC transporter, permease component 2 [uncultured Rubrobacteraceae bacterium]|jgi:multiple sugar transport system permease protein|uniref:Various polyols ABC transporter, permease component 2 n=1 Tax=uncultured Rubrobacteraceae bacterium TaxID=349277 RepID=A0A6J4NWI7_9ACTN|nr:Various polyols ABC transporter, permease component 2 [uncultured Rubrobacteraceae bacterium]